MNPPTSPPTHWENISLALVVTRREVRDTLRDWRITLPIMLLTLVFPIMMSLLAELMIEFLTRYRASVLAEKSLPLLLMVVGFFPISFSLIIALETFVGERERQSLEPLLATPLSNTQLYLGKTLAALIPPLLASYLGILLYLIGLMVTLSYRPPIVLVVQIILLTTAEAMVMVSGAVVVSSQTTSVRAANLLASFIIIPMAFLVQGEALIMVLGRHNALWAMLVALIVGDLILVRMGIRVFDRDTLLGREIDTLSPRSAWGAFKKHLIRPLGPDKELGLSRFYRQDMLPLLRENHLAFNAVGVSLVAAILIGVLLAARFPFPSGIWQIEDIDNQAFETFEGLPFLPTLTTWGILLHNVRGLLIATALSIFSFGSLSLLLLMVPVAIIGFLAAQAAISGYNVLTFLGVFVLPHGIFELPAAIIATAMALKVGASIISPPPHMSISQAWLRALADWLRVFLLIVLPLLLVAAFIEVNLTPKIVVAVYGG